MVAPFLQVPADAINRVTARQPQQARYQQYNDDQPLHNSLLNLRLQFVTSSLSAVLVRDFNKKCPSRENIWGTKEER